MDRYEIRQVARAVTVPVRRLEGWVERKVVVPSAPARGTGRRRGFSRADVLHVAIVAELARLFGGSHLRPGLIAAAVKRYADANNYFGSVLRATAVSVSAEDRPAATRPPHKLAMISGPKGPRVFIARQSADELLAAYGPALAIVDLVALWDEVQRKLQATQPVFFDR